MSDLSELLNGSPETEETTTVETTAESLEESTEVAAEEQKTTKEETKEETTEQETTGLKDGLPSSEELQQQLDATTKELNAYKTKARDKTDRYNQQKEEYEALQKRLEGLPDALEDQKGFTQGLHREFGEIVNNQIANQSEFFARREFGTDKVDAAFVRYEQLRAENPALDAEVQGSVSPWHTMMDIVDQADKLAQVNDPNYMANLESEIEAKIRAKIKAESDAKEKETASISPNLAKEGSESVADNSWTGPTPLNSLLA